MDMSTPNPPHPLSGHNPTLFNIVVQYADMDMLRALALTSPSLYETLQHCRFNHLSVVVLEAPILEEQPQVVYNGADPVPDDIFELPPNDTTTSTTPTSSTSPSSQTQNPALIDIQAFKDWQYRSVIHIDYSHDLIIPDYARNFMARAQSVELVVYRRRLGTHISAFFTDNAHHLKHGKPLAASSCVESSSKTTQYNHLPCSPTPHTHHCNQYDERVHGGADNPTSSSDNGCIFSKHCSHEYGDSSMAESRRKRFHTPPDTPWRAREGFPYSELSPLQLVDDEFYSGNSTTHTHEQNVARKNKKRKRHTNRVFYRDFDIHPSSSNTRVFRPRFQNLPLAEQRAPTTSLSIRIVDCISFDIEDWTNAIPGCAIQPFQTWIIHDDAKAPHHRRHPPDRTMRIAWDNFHERILFPRVSVNHDVDNDDGHIHLGHHFPHLTSLVLQYTRLDEVNQCGTEPPGHYRRVDLHSPSRPSHFFIGNDMDLPHLQHFGVVGTLLDAQQCADIAFYNVHTSSLNFDPGPQPTGRYLASPILQWMYALGSALNGFEDYEIMISPDGVRRVYRVTDPTIHHEDDMDANVEEDSPHRVPPPQPRGESLQQVEPKEPKHKLRPRRKYNFSFGFANSHVDSCCPHERDIIRMCPRVRRRPLCKDVCFAFGDCSHFNQHLLTCAAIHRSLADVYWADRNGPENYYRLPLSRSPPLELVFPRTKDVVSEDTFTFMAIALLTYLTLTHLDLRCHYCSQANPGTTLFPGASPGDCTTTRLPPSVSAPLDITDLSQDDRDALPRTRTTQYSKEMYMRLRELLHVPPHVVLRL